jgi:TolB-like protein/Tfp pilus assembly protein PilF
MLRAAGIEVWWDSDLRTGAAFAGETEAALEAADVVIVAWSTTSVQSNWVKDEAGSGRDRGRLLPLRIDDVTVPLGFRQTQWIDLLRWNGRSDAPAAQALVAAALQLAGQPEAVLPPKIKQRPQWLTPARAGLVGLAILGLGTTAAIWSGTACEVAKIACPAPAARNSIAVLPFANLSGHADQAYFADGLTEELQARLSRFSGLAVAGRTSSFRFRDRRESSAAIGKALSVDYLLDGSVRREGNVVRVSAQLVDAQSGFQRWGATYDRELKDIFSVQAGIAEAVASALRVTLLGQDTQALSRGGTIDPAAWDAFLKGRALFSSGGGAEAYRAALARFDAAIAADPAFAAAHAARARVLVSLANQFVAPNEMRATYDAALASARRAVALAPTLADAQTTLAVALIEADRNFAGAGAAFAQAMAAGAQDATTRLRYGLYALRIGKTAEAKAALSDAARLDPLNPVAHRALGYAATRAGDFAMAIAAQKRALELSPGSVGAHAEIGKALLLQGKLEEARAAYALEPEEWERLTGEAILHARLGDTPRAEAALAALRALPTGTTWYQQAQIFAQWGKPAAAFAALAAAYSAGDSGLNGVLADPFMDPLAKDARFRQILRKLGLDSAKN